MSETPRKYTAALKRYTGLRAVWPPTSAWEIGDYIVREEGFFHKIGNLESDFGIRVVPSAGPTLEIHFQTSKVYITKIEAGAKVSEFSNNLNAKAKLEFNFRGNHSFFMHSKPADSTAMKEKRRVGKRIARQVGKWKHREWFVISEVYRADSFILLANKEGKRKVTISGDISGVNAFLQGNVAPSLQISSLVGMGLKILGKQSGPIAVELFRVKGNGDIEFS